MIANIDEKMRIFSQGRERPNIYDPTWAAVSKLLNCPSPSGAVNYSKLGGSPIRR